MGDGADAAVLSFLEENSLASYPTKDAIIAANISMETLLGWNEEDMKLFVETYGIRDRVC